jgi:hypothetical protein
VTHDACNKEEVLHVVKRFANSLYLQIANIAQEESPEVVEKAWHEWASEEGWLD